MKIGNNSEVMTNEEYFEFFKNIFEIWIKDNNKIKLKQINEIYEEFAKSLEPKFEFKKCSCSGNCFQNFVSLDMEGNLYSCNRTYNNNHFYYGNIKDIDNNDINRKIQKILEDRNRYILNSKCAKCEMYEECRGGCPANAYVQHGDINRADDYFCSAKIKIRKYIKNRLEELGITEEYKENLKKKRETKNVIA